MIYCLLAIFATAILSITAVQACRQLCRVDSQIHLGNYVLSSQVVYLFSKLELFAIKSMPGLVTEASAFSTSLFLVPYSWAITHFLKAKSKLPCHRSLRVL